jgi:hypothetical protein
VPGSRAQRRAAGHQRSRPLQIVTVVAVLALLGTAGFLFLRDDDGGNSGGGGGGGTPEPEVSIGDVELTAAGVFTANAGPPVPAPPELTEGVLTTVGAYIDGGLIEPIRSGDAAGDIAGIFEAGAAAQLEGPDRSALFDEGLPEVTGTFTPAAQPVPITALSDAGGAFVLATAILTYSAELETADGPVTVGRTAELTMVPQPDGWKIMTYDVLVTRDGGGIAPTTTTAASS